jgi:alkylation response protein AidB-like acyl-CoA dehydrogenase
VNVAFSAEHEAFRDEVRGFLESALTDELRDAQRRCPGIFLDYRHNIVWHRILHRQGWVAPSWPKEHGGTGWDLTRRYIWATESTLAGAPSLAPMGLGMCGPMLIGFGTQAQKDYYLPRILSGEDYWCQGYSEPGAGSDLASLKLRADSDGDHYVLNGTKIWTTHAHVANRMFCLVRTGEGGKPQAGITFVLLDMDSPGITVEPILFASGTHEVNQVFFDDVRVPRANRVGEENQGWTVAKYLLEFERGGGGSVAQQTALARVRRIAATIPMDGGTLADDAAFKRKLDAMHVQVQAAQYTEHRIMAALSQGRNPGPESSLMKNLGADNSQRITELMVEAVGHASVVPPVDAAAPADSAESSMAFTRHFNLRASSIAGGTNEVQKNIIAKLVLGL